MHWCADEMFALMSMVPFVKTLISRVHVWWHTKFNTRCHTVRDVIVSKLSFDKDPVSWMRKATEEVRIVVTNDDGSVYAAFGGSLRVDDVND